MSGESADVAVLTAISEELTWARVAFEFGRSDRRKHLDGSVYWLRRFHSYLTGRNYKVVLGCIGWPGNSASAAATMAMIKDYRPRLVVLVGMAAGLRGKVRIGEAVIGERVVGYEQAALVRREDGTEDVEPRPDIALVAHTLQQDIANYDTKAAEPRVNSRFRALGGAYPIPAPGSEVEYRTHVATAPRIRTTTIASGEKLVRNDRVLYFLRTSLHGKIEAVEMEAAGFVVSCQRAGVPWLAVRGISDFGDQFKNDLFHELAARMAALVTRDFLEYGLELVEGEPRDLQSRFVATKPSGRRVQIVTEEEIKRLLTGKLSMHLRTLERNLRSPDSRDLERIAARIAAEFVDDWLERLPPEEQQEWWERVTGLAYDIALALIGTGIWAAAAYAMARIVFLESDKLTEDQSRYQARMVAIREKLAVGMSLEMKEELPHVTEQLMESLALEERIQRTLKQTETFQEFVLLAQAQHPTLSGDHTEWCAMTFAGTLIVWLRSLTLEGILPSEEEMRD